jgi:hypothetical protein
VMRVCKMAAFMISGGKKTAQGEVEVESWNSEDVFLMKSKPLLVGCLSPLQTRREVLMVALVQWTSHNLEAQLKIIIATCRWATMSFTTPSCQWTNLMSTMPLSLPCVLWHQIIRVSSVTYHASTLSVLLTTWHTRQFLKLTCKFFRNWHLAESQL